MLDQRKVIGRFYEKRGDDSYTVFTSKNGDVIQVEQYDARAAYNHWLSINLWTESAPQLVELIQKAAGLEPEYEYAVLQKDPRTGYDTLVTSVRIWSDIKENRQAIAKSFNDKVEIDEDGEPEFVYVVVRREKPKGYEEVK